MGWIDTRQSRLIASAIIVMGLAMITLDLHTMGKIRHTALYHSALKSVYTYLFCSVYVSVPNGVHYQVIRFTWAEGIWDANSKWGEIFLSTSTGARRK